MMGQTVLFVSGFLLAFSAVSNSLAIGFEVDTPLDPFLGGLSKMKRQLIRRVKDLGNSFDDSFTNSSPIDQLNMLFAQPPPANLPQFTFPGQTSQQPITTQLPTTTIDQRKAGLNQIPPPIAQAMDAQLMALLNQIQNQGMAKRGLSYPSSPGLRQQVPGILQQLAQAQPFRGYTQSPVTQQKQSFF